MNLRTRLRRWWIGPALYDYAVMSVRLAEDAEAQGKANAHAFLRANGLQHLLRDEKDSR
jgi:hypothetical protein